MSIEGKLAQLGLEIPEVPRPVAAYVPAIKIGNLIFTSGQLPFVKGELKYKGKVDRELTLEDGYQAARICALNCLGAIKELISNLEKIKGIVKVTGYVNCPDDFDKQPQVINGASELLGKLFDKAGEHARSALGVSSLPLGAAVELEMIVELKK